MVLDRIVAELVTRSALLMSFGHDFRARRSGVLRRRFVEVCCSAGPRRTRAGHGIIEYVAWPQRSRAVTVGRVSPGYSTRVTESCDATGTSAPRRRNWSSLRSPARRPCARYPSGRPTRTSGGCADRGHPAEFHMAARVRPRGRYPTMRPAGCRALSRLPARYGRRHLVPRQRAARRRSRGPALRRAATRTVGMR